MARIDLTSAVSGGGGGSTTLSLLTTGTSGPSTLTPISGGYILNVPQYQGQLTLTTTGSGAATLVGNTLNIPTPTSASAAGSTGEVQYNGGSGAFAASSNLFWASGTNRLGIGTNTPNQTLEVSGAMRLTGTAGTATTMLGKNASGDVSTVTLGTTGTSGAATLSANVLNIPQYQGAVSLTTTGTSGASTFAGNTLNIPQYQGALTLTTTGTSGAATLVGTTLNIPQYSGGGGGTPAGNAGEIQFNSTPAGSFAASSNLVFDTSGPFLKVGASAPSATIGVNGVGSLAGTSSLHIRNSSSVDLFKLNDNGQVLIGKNGAGTTQSTASIQISTTDANTNFAIIPKGTGGIISAIPDGTTAGGNARGTYVVDFTMQRTSAAQCATANNSIAIGNFVTSSGAGVAIGYDCSSSGGGAVAIGGAAASGAVNASGSLAIAVGANARATNTYSIAIGAGGNNATGYAATIIGGQDNEATGNTSIVYGGRYGLAYLLGQATISGRRFGSGLGDAQTSNVRLMRSITGTSIQELTLDGTSPSSSTVAVLSLPTGSTNGRLWNFIVQLSAICNTVGNGTLTAGDSFIGTYNGGIKRIGTNTSLVGTVQNMITAQSDANMSSSVVTITADNTNESLKVEFTPPTTAGSTTVIRVVATVYLTEVGY